MRRKAKWIFTAVAVIAYFIFGSSLPDHSLGSRAMAVGLGIDLSENGKYIVSAQILTSGATADDASVTRVVKGEGEVLSAAIAEISEDCGLTLTVTHCNAILFGEKLMRSDKIIKIAYTLFQNSYISDSAYLFGVEGSAEEMLKTKAAFGTNTSEFLQKVVAEYGVYNNIAYKTLRQFFVDYKNIGSANWLPYITKSPVSSTIPSSNASSGGSSDSDFVFKITELAVFKGAEFIGIYGEDASRAVNYFLTDVAKGCECFTTDKETVGLYVLNGSAKKEFDPNTKTVKTDIEIGVTVKDVSENNAYVSSEPIMSIDDETLKFCENKMKEEMEAFFLEMQSKDVDVLRFRQEFYGRYGKEAEFPLAEITLELNVKIKFLK